MLDNNGVHSVGMPNFFCLFQASEAVRAEVVSNQTSCSARRPNAGPDLDSQVPTNTAVPLGLPL